MRCYQCVSTELSLKTAALIPGPEEPTRWLSNAIRKMERVADRKTDLTTRFDLW